MHFPFFPFFFLSFFFLFLFFFPFFFSFFRLGIIAVVIKVYSIGSLVLFSSLFSGCFSSAQTGLRKKNIAITEKKKDLFKVCLLQFNFLIYIPFLQDFQHLFLSQNNIFCPHRAVPDQKKSILPALFFLKKILRKQGI